jgi:hypothetical protein
MVDRTHPESLKVKLLEHPQIELLPLSEFRAPGDSQITLQAHSGTLDRSS